MFCISSLLAGISMGESIENPANRILSSITNGMVNTVITLLKAVRVTDRATSPPAIFEKIFDELPPGEQAISMIPVNITGSGLKIMHSTNAVRGSIMSCPARPIKTGAGLLTNALKSAGARVRPRSNISTVSIGRTIRTGFMGIR